MKRALLISIHPEWAEKILKGEKTIEIRTWIPKDYAGWVYVYITLGELIERHWKKINPIDRQIILYGVGVKKSDLSSPHSLNGKVAFRFWYEKVERIYWTNDKISLPRTETNGVIKFAQKTCLLVPELEKYLNGKVGYAWNIDKLEIFDRPKELGEFWLDPIDFSIHTRAEALAEGYKPIQKAPQKCMWVYLPPEPHQVSVLDEETPNKKDESERKPF